jgi:hypothetical protein
MLLARASWERTTAAPEQALLAGQPGKARVGGATIMRSARTAVRFEREIIDTRLW